MPIKSHILGGGISGGVINFDIYTLIFGNKMETGMGDRKYNEEKYLKLQVEDDEEKNALICDQLADESLMWNPGEAVYWRKKAIEKIENCYGKGDFRNTAYYDKIVNDLMEKGSYKEAVKWNKKSKRIKVKEKGEKSFDVFTNELYELELSILIGKYEDVLNDLTDIPNRVQGFCKQKPLELYNMYLKLIHIEHSYNIHARIHGKDELFDIIQFADRAIELSEEVYGRDSIESAEIYRLKAIGINWNDDEYKLKLLKKSLLTAIKREGNNGVAVRKIFYDVRRCWQEDSWNKSIIWAYKNVSKEFVLDIMGCFPEHIQNIINVTLQKLN